MYARRTQGLAFEMRPRYTGLHHCAFRSV